MGYVPPTGNETAIQYGRRMASPSPAISRVKRVEQTMMYRLRHRDNPYQQRETLSMAKRREEEKKLHRKGQQLDVWM